MKKVIAILITLVMLMFCGCTKTKVEAEYEQTRETSMFVVVERGLSWYVVYHRETKVMYVISCSMYNSGNFCLLVNQDGTPMLWEGGGGNG